MKNTKSKFYLFAAALIFIGAAVAVSFTVGKYPILWHKLFVDPAETRIFFTLRVPRTFMALIAGFALGISGSVFQTVFQNPLASPDIIGVASGCSVGAAISILFLGGAAAITVFSAFIGGVIAVFAAFSLAMASRNRGISSVVLSGIAINALAQAILMYLKLNADPEKQLASIEFWTMGSFADITASKLLKTLLFIIIGFVGLCLLQRPLLMLHLNPSDAQMLGVPVWAVRWTALLLATMLTGSVVSMVGLISFIGLLAPHIAKLITKSSRFSSTIFSGLVGGLLLLLADILARSIGKGEIPVSIITSFLGAPCLFILMCQKGESYEQT